MYRFSMHHRDVDLDSVYLDREHLVFHCDVKRTERDLEHAEQVGARSSSKRITGEVQTTSASNR